MMRRLRSLWVCLALGAAPLASAHEYQSFDSDGVTLAYTEQGSGDPVILLHGFDDRYEGHLQPVTQALSAHFRVIGFDQRGHGRSGKPHADDAYGMHFARDVLNLMDHLRIDKAHVVGHSMGGIVSMYLAAHHAQRLRSVVTVGNGLFKRDELRLIGWLMRGKFLWGDLKIALGLQPAHPATRDEAALVAAVKSLAELSVTQTEAATLTLPVLAARGGPEDDPRNTVERLAQINPAVQTLRVETRDHVSLLGDATFLRTLDAFLRQH